MIEKVIITSKKEIKKGVTEKDGKKIPWTLYGVTDSTGRQGSSFDDLPLDTEIELEVDKVPKGDKIYTNFKRPKANIWEEIRQIKRRLDALEQGDDEAKLENFSPEIKEEEIKAEDLPF